MPEPYVFEEHQMTAAEAEAMYGLKPGTLTALAERCTCGKTRLQHDTQWVACKGFTPEKR